MNFAKRDKSIVDVIFIVALLGVFIVSALFVVLFGARVYSQTVSATDRNYSSRTALSYITEKLRSHDCSGGVEISDEPGAEGQSVVMLKTIGDDNGEYVTYLYVDEGYLKEFTASKDYEFDSFEGSEIMPIKEFRAIKVSESLFEFNIVDGEDNSTHFFVSLYSGTDGEGDDYE